VRSSVIFECCQAPGRLWWRMRAKCLLPIGHSILHWPMQLSSMSGIVEIKSDSSRNMFELDAIGSSRRRIGGFRWRRILRRSLFTGSAGGENRERNLRACFRFGSLGKCFPVHLGLSGTYGRRPSRHFPSSASLRLQGDVPGPARCRASTCRRKNLGELLGCCHESSAIARTAVHGGANARWCARTYITMAGFVCTPRRE
jgi:hypothetical protein